MKNSLETKLTLSKQNEKKESKLARSTSNKDFGNVVKSDGLKLDHISNHQKQELVTR
jgi:hypothetical protein